MPFSVADRKLTPNERRMIYRVVVALAIPMALIVLLVGAIAFYGYRQESLHRIQDNKDAIKRNLVLSQTFNRRIAAIVYDQCVNGEVRDVILADQLRLAIKRTRQAVEIARKEGRPINEQLVQSSINDLQDGINALEPSDEQDCTPPEVKKPRGQP